MSELCKISLLSLFRLENILIGIKNRLTRTYVFIKKKKHPRNTYLNTWSHVSRGPVFCGGLSVFLSYQNPTFCAYFFLTKSYRRTFPKIRTCRRDETLCEKIVRYFFFRLRHRVRRTLLNCVTKYYTEIIWSERNWNDCSRNVCTRLPIL